MCKPKVSVIICIYNVERYLKQSLDSVVNQTLGDIEIICVNDASNDNSLQIVKDYAQKDNRIVVIDLGKNIDLGSARNIGMEAANGEYIMFLDPDDWFELEACELCYRQISANNNDYVLFGYNKYIQKTGKFIPVLSMLKPFKKLIDEPRIKLEEFEGNGLIGGYVWCCIYSRQFLKDNKIYFPDLRIYEDQVFMSKVYLYADTISCINKTLVNYRIHDKSVTLTFSNQHTNMLQAKKIFLKHLHEVNPSSNKKRTLYRYTILSCLHCIEKNFLLFPDYEKEFFKCISKVFNLMDGEYINKAVRAHLAGSQYKKYRLILKDKYVQYKIFMLYNNFLSTFKNLFKKCIIKQV